MKKKILLISIIFILTLTGCSLKKNENLYKIELNKEPYEICGKEIYFSNDSYGDELYINKIIDSIKEACNIEQ